MQAIGYVRVSTEEQANEGVSLEAQQARISAWCLANDFELANVFTDAGLSGKRADNRPALRAALDEACRTKAVLVVYSLSRLARSTRDTLAIAERLDRAGADLASLSERIDTTSAAGKMIFRMLAVLAEFERDLISERTSTALHYKKGKGERVGQVPFGYALASDGRTLVADDSEQDTIRHIHALRAEGFTIQGIADELNRRGIKTKGGGQWFLTSVQRVLKLKPAA